MCVCVCVCVETVREGEGREGLYLSTKLYDDSVETNGGYGSVYLTLMVWYYVSMENGLNGLMLFSN